MLEAKVPQFPVLLPPIRGRGPGEQVDSHGMAGIGNSAQQAGVILMAPLKACLGTGPGSCLRLRLAVIPVVLATLALPAAALGNGALSAATVPRTPALVGAAKGSIPESKAPQAAAQALAVKPVSPPAPPAPPRQDVTSAPVVKAPSPVSAPEPAQPKAVTPTAGGDLPVDSVAKIVKEPIRKVGAVTADPVGTTTKVVQDVQKDVSNLAGLTGGGGPPAPLDPVGTTTKVVQDVQKDVSNLAGLTGGGGPPAPLGPVGTTTRVVQDVQKDVSNLAGLTGGGGPPAPLGLMGTTTKIVQDVQKDVSNLTGLIGGGGPPEADLLQLAPSTQLPPSSDLLSNLAGVVHGGATILGTPVHPLDVAVEQTASVPETPQSPFAASSFEPQQPPPGAHSGGSLPGGGSPSGVGPVPARRRRRGMARSPISLRAPVRCPPATAALPPVPTPAPFPARSPSARSPVSTPASPRRHLNGRVAPSRPCRRFRPCRRCRPWAAVQSRLRSYLDWPMCWPCCWLLQPHGRASVAASPSRADGRWASPASSSDPVSRFTVVLSHRAPPGAFDRGVTHERQSCLRVRRRHQPGARSGNSRGGSATRQGRRRIGDPSIGPGNGHGDEARSGCAAAPAEPACSGSLARPSGCRRTLRTCDSGGRAKRSGKLRPAR